MKKVLLIILIITTLITVGCSTNDAKEKSNIKNQSIILATTTSTQNSGLLDNILPNFRKKTGIEVKVIAVGTGKALQMGKDGDADVLLVHAKPSEEEFVNEGHGLYRKDVMYNDFVIVGPKDDPIKLKEKAPNNVLDGYKLIFDNKALFVSRGDDSGTHKKENSFWQELGVQPNGDWYMSTGGGMGDSLKVANEKQAYIMTDRATYLNLKEVLELDILLEKDDLLFNQYGVIPVNPNKNEFINEEGAKIFIDWILNEETQNLIKLYDFDRLNQSLFIPNAK